MSVGLAPPLPPPPDCNGCALRDRIADNLRDDRDQLTRKAEQAEYWPDAWPQPRADAAASLRPWGCVSLSLFTSASSVALRISGGLSISRIVGPVPGFTMSFTVVRYSKIFVAAAAHSRVRNTSGAAR